MENREVLLKYGKNPAFYSRNREGAGFSAVTSGSAAQSSIIDDFATLPFPAVSKVFFSAEKGNAGERFWRMFGRGSEFYTSEETGNVPAPAQERISATSSSVISHRRAISCSETP